MKHLDPLIIIGMHRSGTTLVTRILEDLGYFMGKRQDSNAEAKFFQELNKWILQGSGGAWDHPEPVTRLLQHAEARALSADYLRHMLESPRVISYLGWQNYFRYRNPFRLDIRWGWKDPRNTFTLPLWLDLFPDARVIHVYRHGVDIAESLRRRENQRIIRQRAVEARNKARRIYWIKPKQDGILLSPRSLDIGGAFSLWESYMSQAQSIADAIPDRFMSIKYEHLLESPVALLETLIGFCQLKMKMEENLRITDKIRPERAYAYLNDLELRSFADSVSSRLNMWGYDAGEV